MTNPGTTKNIYMAIQIVMFSVILGASMQIITELTSDVNEISPLIETSDTVNVDQIVLYIFLIIACLFTGAVFNGKSNKIAEGLGGQK